MNHLIASYENSYRQLDNLLGEKILRELRLFNIRFRLAVDIRVDFAGVISLTKSTEVKNTYKLIIRLMETWNSYEALAHYIRKLGRYDITKESIFLAYTQKTLKDFGTLNILSSTLDTIKDRYDNQPRFKRDFQQYIARIQNDDRIGFKLTTHCTKVIDYFDKKISISGIELIALIYAERNMYYHNGETAKMGMSYPNRQFLINQYLSSLTEHTLKIIIRILDLEIARINKGQ